LAKAKVFTAFGQFYEAQVTRKAVYLR